MAYSPNVEQWRAKVAKYFRPEDVDKALYVINGESGGNPTIKGDNGASIGLFQMNRAGGLGSGSSVSQLEDPDYNIRLAAQAVYGGSGWSPWGEGSTYQGQKFGALGNNPYSGSSSVNARAPSGVQPLAQEKKPAGNTSVGRFARGKIADTISRLQTPKGVQPTSSGSTPKGVQPYTPTGDFDADVAAYLEAMDKAYQDLYKYADNGGLIVDEEEGVVYKYDEAGEPIPDAEGMRLLSIAMRNAASVERLMDRRKANLEGAGADSAAAYLTSEKEKRAEAEAKYADYIGRIGDITAIEDIPVQRAANIAGVLKAANAGRALAEGSPFTTQGAGYGTEGQPKSMDLGGILGGLKGALPAEAPQPYNINPAALEPYGGAGGGSSFPNMQAQNPDEIIAEYNGGAVPGVPAGIGAGTGAAAAPATPTATGGDFASRQAAARSQYQPKGSVLAQGPDFWKKALGLR